MIFKRNKHINNDIFKIIKKEKVFNRNLNILKKEKSFTNLNYTNLILDNLDEYKFKKIRSQQMINNKLIVEQKNNIKFKKDHSVKYKIIGNNKKQKGIKKGKRVYERINLSNKTILFPHDNNIIKSGLNILKGDIAQKMSQKDLPLSSYIKKTSDETNKISNSNTKSLKKRNFVLKSSKNVDYSILKKSFRHSLFNPNENEKKEKNKIQIQNQKAILDSSDNIIKIKSHELSKMNGNIKKIKKSVISKKTFFNLNNDRNLLESKKSKEINKNKIMMSNIIKKTSEKNHISNINKTELNINGTNEEGKTKSIKEYSDKNLSKHIIDISENLNIVNKNKNLKSNKCVHNFVGGLKKIVKIDISHNNFYVKKNINESKNPFNTEQNINNNNPQELRVSKLSSKKIIKSKLPTKNNNIKYYSTKLVKIGGV